MGKLYSDNRWWDDPKPVTSMCCSCKHYCGPMQCDQYGTVPMEILDKSFPEPGTGKYDKEYCAYRENMEE